MGQTTAWVIAVASTLSAVAAGFVLRGASDPGPALAQESGIPVVSVSATPPELPVPGPSSVPTAAPTPPIPAPDIPGATPIPSGPWTVASASVEAACGGKGALAPPARTGPVSLRLSDALPLTSANPDFRPTTEGPVQLLAHPRAEFPMHHPPATAALVLAGARQAYSRGFVHPTEAGGYVVTAYEFANAEAAREGALASYRTLVCDYGATPIAIPQRPEILATTTQVVGGNTSAWWIHGRRVMVVHYSMWADHEEDLGAAIDAIHHAWDAGAAAEPPGP